MVGTQAVLDADDAQQIVGFAINKFRGDVSLFDAGLAAITAHTGWPSLGVHLDAEDAIAAEQILDAELPQLRVVVPVFPRISNHTDFDALRLHPQVDVHYVGPDGDKPAAVINYSARQ